MHVFFYWFQLVAADLLYISCNSVIDIHVFCHSKDDLRIKPETLSHCEDEGDLR